MMAPQHVGRGARDLSTRVGCRQALQVFLLSQPLERDNKWPSPLREKPAGESQRVAYRDQAIRSPDRVPESPQKALVLG
jgi:hypothetical protein